jgi:hypothetical protein
MLNFFSRAFDAFCGYGQPVRPAPAQATQTGQRTAAPKTVRKDDAIEVGCGNANEMQVTIRGLVHLFVEEADHVVHFEQDFETLIGDTAVGKKLVPELYPRWQERDTYPCSLKEAIGRVIRQKEVEAAQHAPGTDVPAEPRREVPEPPTRQPRAERKRATDAEPGGLDYTGRIIGWGEEKFPKRNTDGGKETFYTSFAIRLETDYGKEAVVQGEGLKDAIAKCGCAVGERVGIKRLRKEKVQAFTASGERRMRNGQPVFYDRWVWSIKHL